MPIRPETDDELLGLLEAGDEAAFQVLYRRRQGAIFRFAMHVTGSSAVAEDITQEVFLTLIRNACRYDPERGTLNGYLFGIARKLVFRRVAKAAEASGGLAKPYATNDGRHPIRGALRDITFVPPGVDLTEPADPEWADLLDKKYGPEVR